PQWLIEEKSISGAWCEMLIRRLKRPYEENEDENGRFMSNREYLKINGLEEFCLLSVIDRDRFFSTVCLKYIISDCISFDPSDAIDFAEWISSNEMASLLMQRAIQLQYVD